MFKNTGSTTTWLSATVEIYFSNLLIRPKKNKDCFLGYRKFGMLMTWFNSLEQEKNTSIYRIICYKLLPKYIQWRSHDHFDREQRISKGQPHWFAPTTYLRTRWTQLLIIDESWPTAAKFAGLNQNCCARVFMMWSCTVSYHGLSCQRSYR